MSELIYTVPDWTPLDVPKYFFEVPSSSTEIRNLYKALQTLSDSHTEPKQLTIDVHYYDPLRCVAWFLRYDRVRHYLSLYEFTPFHAGWIQRRTLNGRFTFQFDLDAHKSNVYNFTTRPITLWSYLTEIIAAKFDSTDDERSAIQRKRRKPLKRARFVDE
jgi:hypothetical protein